MGEHFSAVGAMETFEDLVKKMNGWLGQLSNAVDVVNMSHADAVDIKMPRPKDLIVTFQDDPSAQPEQTPAIVVEIEGSAVERVAPLKGMSAASLYVVDEAHNAVDTRLKLMRWVDAIRTHCTSASSLLGSNIRVVPRREQYVMGKTKGDLNGFSLKVDLFISF
jgi:hypothetical protein